MVIRDNRSRDNRVDCILLHNDDIIGVISCSKSKDRDDPITLLHNNNITDFTSFSKSEDTEMQIYFFIMMT